MIPGRTQRQCRTRHLILEGVLKKPTVTTPIEEGNPVQKASPEVVSGLEDDNDQYSESDQSDYPVTFDSQIF